MDERDATPNADSDAPHLRTGQPRQRRRRLLWIVLLTVLGVVTVAFWALVFVGIRALSHSSKEPVIPIAPIEQPGGILRRVVGPDVASEATWTADGLHVVFESYDIDFVREFRRALRGQQSVAQIAVVDVATGEQRLYAMPADVVMFGAILQRPRSREFACCTSRVRLRDLIGGEKLPDIWVFDLARGEFRKKATFRLPDRAAKSGGTDLSLESWAPDGRTLLCSVADENFDTAGYWLVRRSDGRATEVSLPRKPEVAAEPRWSPDSRTLALAWEPGGDSEDDNPARGLWLVEPETGNGHIVRLDPFSVFTWLPNGRVLVCCEQGAGELKETRFGVSPVRDGETEWLPRVVASTAFDIQHAGGRTVVELYFSPGGDEWLFDLYEVTLTDGATRRLTKLDVVDWSLSPTGDRILLDVFESSVDLPAGIYVLDIGPVAAQPSPQRGARASGG
ncbi:MAG: PD40 domain-containing protein [Armatimonadota bacterium]|nr:MAG: PD40 domain-containing protein [Armatimonadota bacterium]